MSDLDKLIEAVERGEADMDCFFAYLPRPQYLRANDAYRGSLDAAISLYDAILGHDGGWVVSQHIAKVVMGELGEDGVYESVIARNPARALLLSTLKAYRSQCPTCPEKS